MELLGVQGSQMKVTSFKNKKFMNYNETKPKKPTNVQEQDERDLTVIFVKMF